MSATDKRGATGRARPARRRTRSSGAFMRAYLAGMPGRLVPRQEPHRPPEGGAAPAAVAAPPALRAAPAESIALGGQIVTPDGPLRGWVTIEGGRITRIATTKPTGSRTLTTDGIICPGLIDLHGHPEFNVFAPWEPPRSYVNRYAWRDSDPYHALIRDPEDKLVATLPKGTQLRYAEIRALVGGVTAIQGASQDTQGTVESLVRNVDGLIFGQHRARALIDLPSSLTSSHGGTTLKNILADITTGDVTAFYVHLAEGQRTNQRSVDEFHHLSVDLKALTEATVIIHGSALTRDQLGDAQDAGARLVWSPQSNLRLYGETTRAADALDVGLPMALGADWLPSGSTSLLAEMKVARQELANQGRPIAAEDLVAMVTSGAAAVASLGDQLGSIAVGRAADVVVLARRDTDAYESVCESVPGDVELVLIGGDLVYGRADWVTQLAQDPTDPRLEPVIAWGRPMLLDTGFEANPDGSSGTTLQQLRADLTAVYPPVGPIWA
jgi:5-methylthioadenosine/S-adenosylhomocysteine deaminase